jgi:hypothetical protein
MARSVECTARALPDMLLVTSSTTSSELMLPSPFRS